MEMTGYYDWKFGTHICPSCKWTGTGHEALIGETFADGAEYHCPKCEYRFGYIAYPLLQESLSDLRAPESDRIFAELALGDAKDRDQVRNRARSAADRDGLRCGYRGPLPGRCR